MNELFAAAPEAVGLSTERIGRLYETCQGWVADGRSPALIVLAARHGGVFLHEAWGQLGPEPDSAPILHDSLFGAASVSKVVTATAVMQLVEQGRIGLHMPVQQSLPEFEGDGFELVTPRHLLTHTSGLPYRSALEPFELGRSGLKLQPGHAMAYSNLGYDLLGLLVERVSGQPFSQFTRQAIFAPLGMKDTTFVQGGVERQRGVRPRPGTAFNWPADLYGQVSPSGTLWTTAWDLAVFGQTFLNRGAYGDFRLLGPATVAAMTRSQVDGLPRETIGGIVSPSCGFAWFMLHEVRHPNYPCLWSPQAYGHAGASGAFLWVDPAYDLVGVFLGAKLSEADYPLHAFGDALMGAITEI